MSSSVSLAVGTKFNPDLTITPSAPTLELGDSITLTAVLTSGGLPLAGKTITWRAEAGEVTPASTVTDSLGRASVTYTAPGFETVDTITASFAGDDSYFPAAGASRATVVYTPPKQATVDIKPETLQIGSGGKWVTCYIELPTADVSQLDVSSVRLERAIPVDPTAPTELGDYDNDGTPDLMVKFDRASVQEIVVPGPATLTVTGDVGGSVFTGADTIDVIDPPLTLRPGALVSVRRGNPDADSAGRDRNRGANPAVREEIYEPALDLSTRVSEREIEITVSSENSGGLTIIVNIEDGVLALEDLDEIMILFDGEKIEMSSDYFDVFDPTDENEAEYLILSGRKGIQLLISIPHFSTHIISISVPARSSVPAHPQPPAPATVQPAQMPTQPFALAVPIWLVIAALIGLAIGATTLIWKFLSGKISQTK
jgi:hypothetical protein